MTDTIAERPVSQALRFTAAGVQQVLVLITTIARITLVNAVDKETSLRLVTELTDKCFLQLHH